MAVEELLTNIADLLDAHGEAEWALSFRRSLSEYKTEPGAAKARIRSVYGGTGSFNDIVLHGPNGMPLSDENDELYRMRSELFALCQSDLGT